MSRAAIAALLGVGGALMIMKGVAGDRSLSETWEAYTGGKKRGDKVTEEFKGLSKEDWVERQQKLRALGFRAPTEGVYNEGMVRAVKDFEREHGLEVDGEWDDEVEEALAEEIEYLEKNGMPKWFHDRIEPYGYQSLEDFERHGQGYIDASDVGRGKALVKDQEVGVFDAASLELASIYEPYWELEPPLPGPQFMTWDDENKKLILGPGHLDAQASVITDLINKVKNSRYFKEMPREWLDAYHRRWGESPTWRKGWAAALGAPLLGVFTPGLIAEEFLKWKYEREFASRQSTQEIMGASIIQGIVVGVLSSRLMFYKGKHIKIDDWKVDQGEKSAAIKVYSELVEGLVVGMVEIQKTSGSIRAAQLDGLIKSAIRKVRGVPNPIIIILEEKD
jgi:peptidoglycan hydrolase-like protein with peptidoglycan-binding domain